MLLVQTKQTKSNDT